MLLPIHIDDLLCSIPKLWCLSSSGNRVLSRHKWNHIQKVLNGYGSSKKSIKRWFPTFLNCSKIPCEHLWPKHRLGLAQFPKLPRSQVDKNNHRGISPNTNWSTTRLCCRTYHQGNGIFCHVDKNAPMDKFFERIEYGCIGCHHQWCSTPHPL